MCHWRKSAETLANTVRKGQQIGVVGRVQTRSYENQQEQKVFVTEVNAERFNYLERRETNQNSCQQQNTGNQNFNNQNNNFDREKDPFSGSTIDISDDDLPF